MAVGIENTAWLRQLLVEVQLEQFYLKLRDELQVYRVTFLRTVYEVPIIVEIPVIEVVSVKSQFCLVKFQLLKSQLFKNCV